MRKTLLTLAALVLATAARAVTIEGYTPEGNFQTVGVTDSGRLLIDVSTQVGYHVIVDAGDNLIVTAATTTATTAATVALPANTVTIIYPADSTRKQGVFCNDDPGVIVHFGDINVTNTTQKYLPYGCFSPDNPESFQGAIYAVSSAAISTSYWYTHKP